MVPEAAWAQARAVVEALGLGRQEASGEQAAPGR
jgi:hypothetical protein